MLRKNLLAIALVLLVSASGCRLAYIFHAGAGQFRLLSNSVPIEEALKKETLSAEQRDRLLLVARIKDFGEKELGLKKTENYQTVYLKSDQSPIYMVSASPKDRLERITWWFPVVGRMPYLGFFDLKSARGEKKKLEEKDLDVIIGEGVAYSTLGWFKDPVTLNLLEGSTLDLADTILHEMTHTTFYVKGQGAFNESLAVLVGRVGAMRFMEKTYGPSHPLTLRAKKAVEDERIFSAFLDSLLVELGSLYDSPISHGEKLERREKVFAESQEAFGHLIEQFQTNRFVYFGHVHWNNAYLMSIELYHRHFRLFEAALKEHGESITATLSFFRSLAKEEGDMLEKIARHIDAKSKVSL